MLASFFTFKFSKTTVKEISFNNKKCIKTHANKFINRNRRKSLYILMVIINYFKTATPLFHKSENSVNYIECK